MKIDTKFSKFRTNFRTVQNFKPFALQSSAMCRSTITLAMAARWFTGARLYRWKCSQTAKFSPENSLLRNLAKVSRPLSELSKLVRLFSQRRGSIADFKLNYILAEIYKLTRKLAIFYLFIQKWPLDIFFDFPETGSIVVDFTFGRLMKCLCQVLCTDILACCNSYLLSISSDRQ